MVTERPIIFSGPMVRAILEGRKNQTRRVVKPQPKHPAVSQSDALPLIWYGYGDLDLDPEVWKCPHGGPGDRLWVREACWMWGKWTPNGTTATGRNKWKFVRVGTGLRYQENQPTVNAKRDGECGWVYRHARYAPKSVSRITLEITDVCVQRVQEISGYDAADEGIPPQGGNSSDGEWRLQMAFKELWDSINAKRGFGWDANPWVWALSFRRLP